MSLECPPDIIHHLFIIFTLLKPETIYFPISVPRPGEAGQQKRFRFTIPLCRREMVMTYNSLNDPRKPSSLAVLLSQKILGLANLGKYSLHSVRENWFGWERKAVSATF